MMAAKRTLPEWKADAERTECGCVESKREEREEREEREGKRENGERKRGSLHLYTHMVSAHALAHYETLFQDMPVRLHDAEKAAPLSPLWRRLLREVLRLEGEHRGEKEGGGGRDEDGEHDAHFDFLHRVRPIHLEALRSVSSLSVVQGVLRGTDVREGSVAGFVEESAAAYADANATGETMPRSGKEKPQGTAAAIVELADWQPS